MLEKLLASNGVQHWDMAALSWNTSATLTLMFLHSRIHSCLPRCYWNGSHLLNTSIASRRHIHFPTVVWPPDQAPGSSTSLDTWHASWIHGSTVRFKCLTPKSRSNPWLRHVVTAAGFQVCRVALDPQFDQPVWIRIQCLNGRARWR